MDFKHNNRIIDEMIDQLFDQLDMGEVCRSSIDRPLDDQKYSLWSDGDSENAYDITTIAWDIFDPVNA